MGLFLERSKNEQLYMKEDTRKQNLVMQEEGGGTGKDGKSAYEIWLEQGNEGTEEDFLESLKGKDGEDGKDYVLTEADKEEIARKAAEKVELPNEYVTETELEAKGYQTKTEAANAYQPKGSYATTEQLAQTEAKIPTKVSQLDNDKKYLEAETDPTVPPWAKNPEKPTYAKSEVGLGNVDNVRQYSANNPPPYPVPSVNGRTGAVEVEEKGAAQTKVTNHNADDKAHNDIRLLISALTKKVNDLLDSDDTTLDQMSEVVAYIKANREILESYTTEKVNVADIIDNLTTSVSNKPLSAKQGVQLKALIDAIKVPTALSQLSGDSTHRTVTDAEKSAWNNKSDFSGEYGDLKNKPTKVTDFTNDAGYQTEAQVQTTVNNAVAELTADGIPDYWKMAVNEAIRKINSYHLTGGRYSTTFAFWSDTHNRWANQGVLVNKVLKETNSPFAFFGGDGVTNDNIDSDATMTAEEKMLLQVAKTKAQLNHIPAQKRCYTIGNHDGMWKTSAGLKYNYPMTKEFDVFFREQGLAGNKHFGGDGTYYYVEDTVAKVRWIVFNSMWFVDEANADGTSNKTTNGFGDEQISWLVEKALVFEEEGWKVVFISHAPLTNKRHSYLRDVKVMQGILTAYQNKGTYTGAYTDTSNPKHNVSTKSVDYSDKITAQIVGWFSGHIHTDSIDKVDNTTDSTNPVTLPFNVVTITGDMQHDYYTTSPVGALGTDTEHAIDFVTILDDGTVHLTRLGGGSDRQYKYKETEATYTNLFDTEGATPNNRMSSSGSDSPLNGYFTSGYINVSGKLKGDGTDKFCIKNPANTASEPYGLASNGATNQKIVYFNSSKTKIGAATLNNSDVNNGVKVIRSNGIDSFIGCKVSGSVNSALKDAVYVRFALCANNTIAGGTAITADAYKDVVITLNEEIT